MKTFLDKKFSKINNTIELNRHFFNPPVSAKEIERFEKYINFCLPDEFHWLYQRANGTKRDNFCDGLKLLSLNEILNVKKIMDDLDNKDTFTLWKKGEWWNMFWIPILDNASYDTVVIDMKGMFHGVPGQLIWWVRDAPERTVLCQSFGRFLEMLIENSQPDNGANLFGEVFTNDEFITKAFNNKNKKGYPYEIKVSPRIN